MTRYVKMTDKEAKDLIDFVLEDTICMDCRTDSPYPEIRREELDRLVKFLMNNYKICSAMSEGGDLDGK